MQYKNVETDCYNFLCDLIKFHALNLNVESVRAFRDMGNDKKAFWNPLNETSDFNEVENCHDLRIYEICCCIVTSLRN